MNWVCTVCAYVHDGDQTPAECPVCHVGADKFKKMEGDMTLAAEHENSIYSKTVKNNPDIKEEDKKFIADFYKYGFVGIMLEWIREGMKENIEDLVRMMDLTLHDTVTTSIHNFQKNNMEK